MFRMDKHCAVWLAACLAAGCGGEAPWQKVFEKLPSALVSVGGTSETDVWAVGGDPGDGAGPLALHFDGTGWIRRRTGATGDLWWVLPFPDGEVFFGGAGGQILRLRDNRFEKVGTPGGSTVFGLWGSSPTDLWAVGGDGSSSGFVWRSSGGDFRAETGLPPGSTDAQSVFKVWGRSPTDVTLVGTGGLILRFNGTGYLADASPTTRTLFTTHVAGERAAAVGGFGSGVLLENEGSGWQDRTPEGAKQLIGVWLTEQGGMAVGANGYVVERQASGWKELRHGLPLNDSLHSVWIDPAGGVWAVGGQVASLPLLDGVLIYRGPAEIPTSIGSE